MSRLRRSKDPDAGSGLPNVCPIGIKNSLLIDRLTDSLGLISLAGNNCATNLGCLVDNRMGYFYKYLMKVVR